jgi:DNA repair exonuclease SbcCD ATPase subunit
LALRINSCIASLDGGSGGRELTFNSNVTVLYGPNGSGKTRLARAITELLWGCRLNGNALTTWENIYLSITASIRNERFTVIRNRNTSLSINSIVHGEETSVLSLSNLGSLETGIHIPDELASIASSTPLLRHLARFTYDTFSATSYMSSPLEGPSAISYEHLRNFFIDDGSRFVKAFQALSSEDSTALKALIREISDHEAEHKRIRKEIDIIDLSSSRAKKLQKERIQIRSELIKLNDELKRFNSAKNLAEHSTAKKAEAEALEKEIVLMEDEIISEKSKITAFDESRSSLSKIFPQFAHFTETQRNNLGKIHDMYRSINKCHDTVEKCKKEKSSIAKRCVSRLIISGILLLPVPAVLYGLPTHFSGFAALSGSIFSASLWSIIAIISIVSFRIQNKKVPLSQAIDTLESQEYRLREILKENSVELDNCSPHETYEFLLQYFEEYGSFSDHEWETDSLGKDIKDDSYFDHKNHELSELKLRLSDLRNDIESEFVSACSISGIKECENTESLVQYIQSDIIRLNEQIHSLEDMNSKLSSEIEREEPRADLKSLYESYGRIEERIEKLKALERSIRCAVTLHEETATRREMRLLGVSIRDAVPIFHALTLNRYISKVNDQTLNEFISSSQPYENTAIGHSLLLAYKLALTRIMDDEQTMIPLFLDEPAANMDSERIKKFIEIIHRFSEKRQIIILTHNKEMFGGAFPLVELS